MEMRIHLAPFDMLNVGGFKQPLSSCWKLSGGWCLMANWDISVMNITVQSCLTLRGFKFFLLTWNLNKETIWSNISALAKLRNGKVCNQRKLKWKLSLRYCGKFLMHETFWLLKEKTLSHSTSLHFTWKYFSAVYFFRFSGKNWKPTFSPLKRFQSVLKLILNFTHASSGGEKSTELNAII